MYTVCTQTVEGRKISARFIVDFMVEIVYN